MRRLALLAAWAAIALPVGAAAAALCAASPTDDTVRPLPVALAPAAARVFGLHAPDSEVARLTVYRCAEGVLLACTAGANLPCGRADTRRVLPAVEAYCRATPAATVVPAYVSGHASLFEWRCAAGRAVATQKRALDGRGFFAAYWKRLDLN